MSDVELKARKAAADFVNACFTDLESLDKVKDVYDDVYKVHETCRQQLDEQVILGLAALFYSPVDSPMHQTCIRVMHV